jgi:glyoxylase-like metal-dependent hydrolase (beta-lactamase superfamily II)
VPLPRRLLPGVALLAAVLVGLLSQLPLAVQGASPEPLRAAQIRPALAVIEGEGGNIAVLTGSDGTLLVDSKFARLAAPVRDAIKAAGGSDPDWLINTHFHFDHTDGNAGFARTGARIVAQENVRRRLAAGSSIAAFSVVTPPAPPQALPVVTFQRSLRLHVDGQTIDLLHLPAAHTDGDAAVHFREADVIHAGDVWFNGMYPFIDVANGGTLDGAIAGVDRLLAMAGPDTRIIPGHGPVGSRADLQSYRTMLATARERLSARKRQGLTVDAVVAAAPLADLEERWGKGLFSGERWIRVIWDGI